MASPIAKPQKLKIKTKEDFDNFRAEYENDAGYEVKYNKKGVVVLGKFTKDAPVQMFKVKATIPFPASLLYDVLHDPVYRAVWDERMIEGKELFRLDSNNDVGYYSMKWPNPLSNRDLVNQRSWYAAPDSSEYIIMNNSVALKDAPIKKKFIRAISVLTGYLVRPTPEGHASFGYITQTDPRGSLPKWLVNAVTGSAAPQAVVALTKACQGYAAWKAKNKPDFKPWLDPSLDPTQHLDPADFEKVQVDIGEYLGGQKAEVVVDDGKDHSDEMDKPSE